VRLVPSDYYSFYRPSPCGLRVYLRQRDEPEAEPSPFGQVLFRLGQRHELAHLAGLPGVLDLRGGTYESRAHRTCEAVLSGTPAIYQGVLITEAVLDGITCEIAGDVDFLIRDGDGYLVRGS
jgi:hypothetical protein